jgi:hypothetical protein
MQELNAIRVKGVSKMTLLIDALFVLIDAIVGLLPSAFQVDLIPSLDPLIDIVGYGLYFFCDYRFFDAIISSYVAWSVAHITFATIRFIYTKFPGISG